METTISQRLRKFVDSTGKTDKEFALQFNATKQEISNWINGTKMGVTRIAELLKAYPEINSGWFLIGKGNMLNPEYKIEIEQINYCNDILCINEKEKYRKLIEELNQKVIQLQQEKIEWLENSKKSD